MTERITVPYTGMTKKQKEELECNHRIEDSLLVIGYTPYRSIPRVTKNFRAKTVAYSRKFDYDDSLATDIHDPANWAIFQHQEGASDDEGTASQATNH